MKELDVLQDLIVVKRSGQRVNFNSTKVAIAIKNAFDHVMPIDNEKKINKVYEDVLEFINASYQDRKTINVEDIQDIIETKLKTNGFKEVYTAFSEYRSRRAASRNALGSKHQHKFTKAIDRIVNENTDTRYATWAPNQVLLDFGKTISSEYTKTFILDNKLVRAHEEGSLYIHNLDYFWLGKLSSTNLIVNEYTLADFPNNLIRELLACKNEIDGEISINNLDELLKSVAIKRFKKDYLKTLTKYLKITDFIDYINIQKIEEIINKENSINFDIDLFNDFALNDKAKQVFKTAYEDTTNNLINYLKKGIRSLLINLNNNHNENKKYGISFNLSGSFENILITNIYLTEILELENLENVRGILKVSCDSDSELLAKVSELILARKNIALSFISASYNKDELETPEYFGNGKRIFENPIYDTKGVTGRMVVSSVSVNMSRLGLKCENKTKEEFYNLFNESLELAKNCLINIFEVIGDKTKSNYREIFKNNILDDDKLECDQKIRKIIKKGVLNLELAGLKECVAALEVSEEKQKELLKEILEYANKKCQEYTKESKLNFVLSETSKQRPLKKLMELDKAIYGVRKNITDKNAYGRLDCLFGFKRDLEQDLKYIGEYQRLLTGGNYVVIELNKSVKQKNILDIISLARECDVGFLRIEVNE